MDQQNITCDSADARTLAELKAQLSAETEKPASQQDLDRINELTEAICLLVGAEEMIVQKSEIASEQIVQTAAAKKSRTRKLRLSVGIPLCAALISGTLAANHYTMKATGKNLISASLIAMQDGYRVLFLINRFDPIILPTTEDDPYGIRTKCEEYDFSPLTPTFIPQGFELKKITISDEGEYGRFLIFRYCRGDVLLNFMYDYYPNLDYMQEYGIPSDTMNVTEEQINGYTVFMLKEDDQFTALFYLDHVVYQIFARDLDYAACEEVLNSMLK